MSRIGKKPVPLPKGVVASVEGQTVKVKGPKGELSVKLVPDVSATLEGRRTTPEVVRRIARVSDVPVTVGGGVASPADVAALLEAGADKVAINSAAIADPTLLSRASSIFGQSRRERR